MDQSPWKPTGSQLVKKFPSYYGKGNFITALTTAHHLLLSWARSIQCMPTHSNSWRSIVILSTHLRLRFANGLFRSGFPTKPLYAPLLSPIRATCPTHLILDLITQTIFGELYRSLSSSLFSFLHYAVTSCHLGTNIPPQYHIIKHLNPTLLPICERPSFTLIQNKEAYSAFEKMRILCGDAMHQVQNLSYESERGLSWESFIFE